MTTELQITQSSPLAMAAEFLKKDSNIDIDKLSKLLDVQERWERNEAKKAYVEAMAAFKASPPTIKKDRHVKFDTQKGKTEYFHASLENVTATINQALSKHGLTASWTTVQNNGSVTVTCVITHVFGHSESTSLTSAPDTSGSKNPIQAIGSAVSYLQRYTLLSLVGLATEGQDDDGAGTSAKPKEPEKKWTKKQKEIAEKLKITLEESEEGKGIILDQLKKYLVWHYKQVGQDVTEDESKIAPLANYILKKKETLRILKGDVE